MKKVHAGQVTSEDAPMEAPALPERVQAALGELVGVAREGLLALSVGGRARRDAGADGRGGR